MIEVFLAGGPVMYPLLFCSVISLAMIIERLMFWSLLQRQRCPELLSAFSRQLPEKGSREFYRFHRDIVGRILAAGMQVQDKQPEMEMQLASETALNRMSRYQGTLRMMVSLTPLLGIFGTVLGIIESFSLLGDRSVVDPIAASGGLAEALITTAFGLAIAMPSLIAFTYFQYQIESVTREIELRCSELEHHLHKNPEHPN